MLQKTAKRGYSSLSELDLCGHLPVGPRELLLGVSYVDLLRAEGWGAWEGQGRAGLWWIFLNRFTKVGLRRRRLLLVCTVPLIGFYLLRLVEFSTACTPCHAWMSFSHRASVERAKTNKNKRHRQEEDITFACLGSDWGSSFPSGGEAYLSRPPLLFLKDTFPCSLSSYRVCSAFLSLPFTCFRSWGRVFSCSPLHTQFLAPFLILCFHFLCIVGQIVASVGVLFCRALFFFSPSFVYILLIERVGYVVTIRARSHLFLCCARIALSLSSFSHLFAHYFLQVLFAGIYLLLPFSLFFLCMEFGALLVAFPVKVLFSGQFLA